MVQFRRVDGALPQQPNVNLSLPASKKVVTIALSAILSFAAFLLLLPGLAIAATAAIIVLTALSLKTSRKIFQTATKTNNSYWFWPIRQPKTPEARPREWFWPVFRTKQPETRPGNRFWSICRPIEPQAMSAKLDLGRIPVGTNAKSPLIQKSQIFRGERVAPKVVLCGNSSPVMGSRVGIRETHGHSGYRGKKAVLQEEEADSERIRVGEPVRFRV
ncbi:MAG: hypothetical protein ACD_7C00405G0001 [uncultured bacterium]|nr:MAG: hypothetical protein ACD_7C00405G0001 [uncultured bacterium]